MTAKPQWYRGNLHMHSFWSDGHGFPEMIAEWFYDRGYHFIAFTEHDRLQVGEKWIACDPQTEQGRSIEQADLLGQYLQRFGDGWVEARERRGRIEVRLKQLAEYRPVLEEPGRFLMMHGEEITARWGEGSLESTHWINALNVETAVPPQRCAHSAEVIKSTLNAATSGRHGPNVVAWLNHPNWRWNASVEQVLAVEDLRFMEIHTALNPCNNYGDDSHPSVERIWDLVLSRRLEEAGGPLLYGITSDDSHAYEPGHHLLGDWALPGRAWVMVRCAELAGDRLVDAMKRGEFYCSSGVILRALEFDGQRLRLEIAPQDKAGFLTQFIGTRRGRDGDEQVGQVLSEVRGQEAQHELRGDELYVRAAIRSDRPHPNPTAAGDVQKAWTQPITPKGA